MESETILTWADLHYKTAKMAPCLQLWIHKARGVKRSEKVVTEFIQAKNFSALKSQTKGMSDAASEQKALLMPASFIDLVWDHHASFRPVFLYVSNQ